MIRFSEECKGSVTPGPLAAILVLADGDRCREHVGLECNDHCTVLRERGKKI